MKILAIDYGKKWIGLAISDDNNRLAFPYKTLENKYIDNPEIKNLFNEPAYITAIKKQNDKESFRMFNLKQDNSYGSFGYNSNFNAYFLVEDFYGYSGIKPRAFQDLIDVVGPANTSMWRMLNVKYIVFDKEVNSPDLQLIYRSDKSFVYLKD